VFCSSGARAVAISKPVLTKHCAMNNVRLGIGDEHIAQKSVGTRCRGKPRFPGPGWARPPPAGLSRRGAFRLDGLSRPVRIENRRSRAGYIQQFRRFREEWIARDITRLIHHLPQGTRKIGNELPSTLVNVRPDWPGPPRGDRERAWVEGKVAAASDTGLALGQFDALIVPPMPAVAP